ncbi:MAG: hypothetical protein ACR2PI_18285, partial [Hyphomicrobiaceae bacterium]
MGSWLLFLMLNTDRCEEAATGAPWPRYDLSPANASLVPPGRALVIAKVAAEASTAHTTFVVVFRMGVSLLTSYRIGRDS